MVLWVVRGETMRGGVSMRLGVGGVMVVGLREEGIWDCRVKWCKALMTHVAVPRIIPYAPTNTNG